MEVKFKKLSDKAVLPYKAHSTDAGLDLTCTNITSEINECGQFILVYHTGIAAEIPTGYVGLVFQRSSICKKSLSLTNAVGVIDSGYRGEILLKFKNTSGDSIPAVYNIGDRVAQLIIMPYPEIEPVFADNLSESERGEDGYGSSDKKDISADTGSQNTETAPDQAAEPANGSESDK